MRHNVADRVSAGTDIIDSRDILERIEELESALSAVDCASCKGTGVQTDANSVQTDDVCDECEGAGTIDLGDMLPEQREKCESYQALTDEHEELIRLRELVEEIDNNAGDKARDGVGLIADHYFERYAQELADDIGAINADAVWPVCHIDWEAAAESLKMDYSSIEYDGVTYWVRS